MEGKAQCGKYGKRTLRYGRAGPDRAGQGEVRHGGVMQGAVRYGKVR